jgi:hypothetical protein
MYSNQKKYLKLLQTKTAAERTQNAVYDNFKELMELKY